MQKLQLYHKLYLELRDSNKHRSTFEMENTSHAHKSLSENAQFIIDSGVNGYIPPGFNKKVSGDEAVRLAIGDLSLKYDMAQKHMVILALEEIAQLFVREIKEQSNV